MFSEAAVDDVVGGITDSIYDDLQDLDQYNPYYYSVSPGEYANDW